MAKDPGKSPSHCRQQKPLPPQVFVFLIEERSIADGDRNRPDPISSSLLLSSRLSRRVRHGQEEGSVISILLVFIVSLMNGLISRRL